MSRFNIDFFEFCFLTEACITPAPIARTHFFQGVSDKHYYQMTDNERKRIYDWILNSHKFDEKDEYCELFKARYNPDNQYLVYTKHKGKDHLHECFLYKEIITPKKTLTSHPNL